jgi:putative ABC transport system permease protein
MLRNYIKIAWRNIRKNAFHSSINVFGLSIGIVFTLVISTYVWNELRVNKTLRSANHQYFLKSEWKDPNLGADITTLGPLSKRLKEDYPNLVANYYRWDGITSVVSKGDKHFREGIQLGDSTLLSMFGFPLLHGDVRTALNNPYSVVITPQIAIKYFGRTDVIGETVSIQSFSGSQHDFAITGVLKELPENSVTQLNAENNNSLFIPANTYTYFGRAGFEAWTNIYVPSYIELKKGITAKDLEKPIQQLIGQNAPNGIKQNLSVVPIALTDYYLQKDNGLVKRMLYTLSFVGLFILLMAVINFINISIRSSSTRMKEIGMRKVMGGLRKQVILQFLTESVTIVFMAMVLAIAVYPFVTPLFSQLIGKAMPEFSAFPFYFIFIPAAFVIVTGVLAGLYPAFILSSINTIDSLKGKLKSVKENVLLRKSLVGLQFSIAAIVMIAAFVVSQQVGYFFSQSLGYNKEYIVSSQVPRDWSPAGVRKMEIVRNEFAAMPGVSAATLSYEIPNGMNGGQPSVYKTGTDSTQAVAMQDMATDENYLSTYQIALKAGSFFRGGEKDSSGVVINEKAVATLGWKSAEEAIGKQVKISGSNLILTIQGVTDNFHFNTMQQEIAPMILFQVRLVNAYRFLSFKIKPGNIGATLEAIQKKWATLLPGSSFEYRFMDEVLKKLYASELQMKKAAYTATVLTLIIVLLGVLGLISLSVQKRTKEIGVRKILGASPYSIVSLFLKEFLPVLLVGGIISIPVAWYVMRGWLNDYAYRISLTPQPFLISITILGCITTIVISLQTAKTSAQNPVKNLRTE